MKWCWAEKRSPVAIKRDFYVDPMLPSAEVIALLSSLELFRSVPEAVVRELAGVLREQTILDGATLIERGATDDCLYVVVSGRLEVAICVDNAEKALTKCGPGELVGEVAFLTGQPRSATISALEVTRVLRLARVDFDAVGRRHPEAAADMRAVLSHRLLRSLLGSGLRQAGLFGTLDESVLSALEPDFEMVTLQAGEILFRQGALGDSLYLVISGRLRVVIKEDDGGQRPVAELGRGETVGEMAVLGGEFRSATVYAVRDTNLAKLSRANFDRHLATYPLAIAPVFTKTIVARLRQQTSGPRFGGERLNTIAVAPASVDVDLERFCTRLTAALSSYGRCLHLSSSRLDSLLWPGASQAPGDHHATSVVAERLAILEADHRYVIYQTDDSGSSWTRRCARQADHILLVADNSADPEPRDVERVMQVAPGVPGAKQSLVLLHADASRLPSGTSRWLAPRQVDAHYHVRPNGEGDVERLARVLTRQAVGLVLGGGFARGLGHAGIVRALEELAIPIDFVGGTSMGAAIGALCAMGYNAERMLRDASEGMARAFQGDFTLPLVALMSGRGIARAVHEQVGVLDIEDTWLPYFNVSANLTRGRKQVHTRGSLARSVLASTRAPGVYPPIVWDGDLLVDGGIVDNLPAGVMKEFSKGAKVIAVDVSPTIDRTMTADYGFEVSGWRALRDRLNPFAKGKVEALTMTRILLRTMSFGDASRQTTGRAVADLYIKAPLEGFKINDFKRAREMADATYASALPHIRAWQSGVQPHAEAPDGAPSPTPTAGT